MRLYDQSRDISNLIKTILYHNSFRSGFFINHLSFDLPHFLDQPSKSTF